MNNYIPLTNTDEIWKQVSGFEYYYVSNMGRLKSKVSNRKEKMLKDSTDGDGYIRNGLTKDKKIIQKFRHSLVAEAFIPNPDNKQTVDHINNNEKTNNKVTNLRWATYKEQSKNIRFVKNHQNGYGSHQIHRVDDNNTILQTYNSYNLCAEWIIEKYNKNNVLTKNKKQLKNLITSMGKSIKNHIISKTKYYGFNWMYKEVPLQYDNEIWKQVDVTIIPPIILDNIPYYHSISSFGRLKIPVKKQTKIGKNSHSIFKEYIIKDKFCIVKKNSKSKCKGYYQYKHNKIHNIVAKSFIPNPDNKPIVNHKDGDTLNNCIDNLEYVSNKENVQHAYDIGLNPNKRKIIQYDNKKDKNIIKEFNSIREVSNELGLVYQNIIKVCKNEYGRNSVGGFYFEYKEQTEGDVRTFDDRNTDGKKLNMNRQKKRNSRTDDEKKAARAKINAKYIKKRDAKPFDVITTDGTFVKSFNYQMEAR